MGRIAFWSLAALVAASVAYAVTVPGALERLSPVEQEAVSGEEAVGDEEAAGEAETPAQPESAIDTPAVEASAAEPAPAPEQSDRQAALPETLPPEEAEQQAALPEAPMPDEAEPQAESPQAARPEPLARTPAPGTAAVLQPGTAPLTAPTAPRLPMPAAPSGPRQPMPAAPSPRQAEPTAVAVGPLPSAGLPFDPGCGLTLRPVGEDRTIFASGVSLEPIGGPAAIQVDGSVVALRRTGVDGEPIGYNQFPRQLFQDSGETVNVLVEIALEEDGLGETARVTGGTVTVVKADRAPAQFEVGGRAGC